MKKEFFSVKNITYMAMFSALSYVISLIEFPIFPQIPTLKMDFSFAIMLLGAYILGILQGEIIVVIVQLLRLITTSTMGIGELANFIFAQCFVVLPAVIYKYKKGLLAVTITLVCCSLLEAIISLFFNRYVLLPLLSGDLAETIFKSSYYYIFAFNLIKCFSCGLVCVLLYKKLKLLLNRLIK